MKIGVQFAPQHCTFAQLRDAFLEADALGVDSLWTWDHFFPLSGDSTGPNWEGWTTLAALGAQTKHATVGHLVLSMGYRNPALLAKMATTLDWAMQGRLILGLGSGWFERDYQEFGYDFTTAPKRLTLLERGIQTIEKHWQDDEPKPMRGTIPILIGGGGRKVTLRIVAQHANLWHGFGTPEQWGETNAALSAWCTRVGRDPASIERVAPAKVEELDQLERYVAAGAQSFILGFGASFDLAPLRTLLAWRDAQNQG